MKKIISFLLCLLILLSVVFSVSFGADTAYSGVVNSKTPTGKSSMKWAKKLGEGYSFAPTSPVVSGDSIITYAGMKLFKLNASNGNVVSSADMVGRNTYTTVSPCIAGGMIFVQLNDGVIQAFDLKTMKSLWVYRDAVGGQSLCNITYSDGYIYTGFWKGETEKANYVCISVKDENKNKTNESKKAKWSFSVKGGFYWADACISGSYVLFGSDDGGKDSNGNSAVYSLNKSNGKKVSSLKLKGDLRSGIAYDSSSKKYFISSKSGLLYSFKLSSAGALSSLKSLKLSGSATMTPVICSGRLYLGSSGGSVGSGSFYVIDTSTLKVIYSLKLSGYPQASPLVSKGYEKDGKIYVYFTVNSKPGSVYMFADSKGQTKSSVTTIFSPADKYSQYCISRIAAGEDGVLYYKNDSGAIFAVRKQSANVIVEFINRILSAFSSLFSKK